MSALDRNDEDLLARLAAGEIDEHAPAARARLAENAELAREWASLRDVRVLLDDTAHEERATLAEARATELATHAGARAAELAPHAAELATRTRAGAAVRAPSRRGRWLALAAAALVLSLSWAVWRVARSGTDDASLRTPLGAANARCVAPSGPVSSWRGFEVEGVVPPGGWCVIAIRAEGASTDLFVSPRLKTPAWTPTDAELARFPARIAWRVEIRDASGTLSGSDSAAAWLER